MQAILNIGTDLSVRFPGDNAPSNEISVAQIPRTSQCAVVELASALAQDQSLEERIDADCEP